MAKKDTWAALRQIVLDRDGPRCYYCHVPTAATIEHLQTRDSFGAHQIHNLVLACPYCNFARGNMSMDEWRQKRGWEMPLPLGLGSDLEMMLKNKYPKLQRRGKYIWTKSTNSRIKIEDDFVILQVRSSKDFPWYERKIGKKNTARSVAAVYEFIRRHGSRPEK